jgi:hypothetical protein
MVQDIELSKFGTRSGGTFSARACLIPTEHRIARRYEKVASTPEPAP